MADDEVIIKFGAEISDLVAGVGGIKGQLEGLSGFARTAAEAFGSLFAVDRIVEFVRSMGELGEKTDSLAATLGISTEAVGELNAMALLTGTDVDTLALSTERISLNVQRAAKDAFSPAAAALKVLHLNAKDLIGLSADQYFLKLADAAEKLKPGLNLTNALMEIGGRGAQRIVSSLVEGRAALQTYGDVAKQTGTALSDETVKGLVETQHEIVTLGLSLKGLSVSGFDAFKGSVDGVIISLTELFNWLRRATEETGLLGDAFGAVVEVGKALAFTVTTAVAAFELLATSAGFLGKELTFKASIQDAEKMAEALEEIGDKYNEAIEKIYGPPKKAVTPEVEKPDPGAMNLALREQQAAAAAALDERIKQADQQYAMTKEHLESEVKTFQITESEKNVALAAALNQRDDLEQSFLQKKLDLYQKGTKSYQDVLNEMSKMHGTFKGEELKTQDKIAEEQIRSWQSALTPIQSAFDSQLKGLLSKTETWQKAMKSIVADMVIDMIKNLEKILIVNTIAAKMQEAFKSGLSGPVDLSGFIKEIGGAVASTYAKSADYFTGIVGPIAAIPLAAAVAATVGTTAAALMAFSGPKAEQGAWNVPETSPWMLHKGETVLPPEAAAAFRQTAGGGGGGDVHFHISAIDGASVQRMLQTHAGTFARTMQSHMAANPTSHG